MCRTVSKLDALPQVVANVRVHVIQTKRQTTGNAAQINHDVVFEIEVVGVVDVEPELLQQVHWVSVAQDVIDNVAKLLFPQLALHATPHRVLPAESGHHAELELVENCNN